MTTDTEDKTATDEALAGDDNVKGIMDQVRKLHADLIPIEEEMIRLRSKKAEVRKRFSAQTGMALADFDLSRRLAMIEDDGDRQEKIINTRIAYEALKPGEQMKMFEATDPPEPGAGPTDDAKERLFNDKRRMEAAGYTAGSGGAGAETCPVPTDHKNWGAWDKGWQKAQAEAAEKLNPKK